MAIVQEDAIVAHRADKKRKALVSQSNSSVPKYRLDQSTPHRAPVQQAQPRGKWVYRGPVQQHRNAPRQSMQQHQHKQ